MDAAAFTRAYDAHAPELYRHLVFRTSNRHVAEDLTAQTFLRAWEYLAGGGSIENVRAFLFQVAHRLTIDHYRMRGRQPIPLDDLLADPPTPGFAEHVRARIDLQEVLAVLGELPERHRRFLVLRFINELDIPEIAEIFNMSRNAVSVAIHRATKLLRVRIAERVGKSVGAASSA